MTSNVGSFLRWTSKQTTAHKVWMRSLHGRRRRARLKHINSMRKRSEQVKRHTLPFTEEDRKCLRKVLGIA